MSIVAAFVEKTAPRPLLVGESNPYGTDPKFALYPAPERSAGYRLCVEIFGMVRAEYLRRFDRANLCEGSYSTVKARAGFEALLGEYREAVILLGSKVCAAARVGFEPYTIQRYRVDVPEPGRRFVEPDPTGHLTIVVLPHPSGLCRMWNEPGAIDRARSAMLTAGISLC